MPNARNQLTRQFNRLGIFLGTILALIAAFPDLVRLTGNRAVWDLAVVRSAIFLGVLGFVIGWAIMRILGWVIMSYFHHQYVNSLDRFRRRKRTRKRR